MARDGSGTYTKPASTDAVSGATISSTKWNTLTDDLEAVLNTARPINKGGTGATSASAARTGLGLEIGGNVQAHDAGLLSIAGLTTIADRMIYATASDTYAVSPITTFGRSLIDDASAGDALTTLGVTAFAKTILDDTTAAGVRATIGAGTGDGTGDGDLLASNNLSDVDTAATALSNLGGLPSASYTATDVLAKLLTVDGAGSLVDADKLDGLESTQFLRSDADSSYSGGVLTLSTGPGVEIAAGTADGSIDAPQVFQPTAGADALMSFHIAGQFAAHFGLASDSNDFVVGGWSMGASVSYRIRHEGNFGKTEIDALNTVGTVTTGTMTVIGNVNRVTLLTGDMTIPGAILSAGDHGVLVNSSASARTITGSITNMFVNGADAATATIPARGVCGWVAEDANNVYLTGDIS